MSIEYNVIKPSTEKELSQELRSTSLTGAQLLLIVQKSIEGDDLAKRRGEVPQEEEAVFTPELMILERPTALLGEVAIKSVMMAARLEAIGSDEDDSSPLRLVVNNPDI